MRRHNARNARRVARGFQKKLAQLSPARRGPPCRSPRRGAAASCGPALPGRRRLEVRIRTPHASAGAPRPTTCEVGSVRGGNTRGASPNHAETPGPPCGRKPMVGVEPTTPALRKPCSAIELHRRRGPPRSHVDQLRNVAGRNQGPARSAPFAAAASMSSDRGQVAMGFEPMKNGFAIRSLSPLGHATATRPSPAPRRRSDRDYKAPRRGVASSAPVRVPAGTRARARSGGVVTTRQAIDP